MDLVYSKADRSEIGVLRGYTLDLAFGADENNFDLVVSVEGNVCEPGYFIYLDGTEYGGVIDSVSIDTDADRVKYTGRTWHGILENKILTPPSGQDYYIVSGDCNAVLGEIITKLGLSAYFKASSAVSPVSVSNYQFERYCKAYTAVVDMLASVSGKLSMYYDRVSQKVVMSAVRAVDYSANEPIDSDHATFKATHNARPVNHLICAGKGELRNRIIRHLYADANGNVSTTKTFSGVDEVVQFYDASSSDATRLVEDGTKKLKDLQVADSIEVSLEPKYEYDIGDVIEAYDRGAGLSATTVISKKIVNVENDIVTISYDVGGYTDNAIKQIQKLADDASSAVRSSDISKTLSESKMRVFTSEPTPPYSVGDLWVKTETVGGIEQTVILVCKTAKEE